MTVVVEEVLPGPRERVFALLSDVERTAGLGPENVRTTWQDERRGVGAVFTGVNRNGDREWEVPCTVVVHDPPARFGWTTGDPDRPSATWTYELHDADGGTRVVQRFRHGPGFTYLRRVVEKHPERAQELVDGRAAQLEQGMRTTLQAAARLL